jgi:hypothetical protein
VLSVGLWRAAAGSSLARAQAEGDRTREVAAFADRELRAVSAAGDSISDAQLMEAQLAAARAIRAAACGGLAAEGATEGGGGAPAVPRCGGCGGWPGDGGGAYPGCARCGSVVVAVVGKGHIKGIAMAMALLAAAAAGGGVEGEGEKSMPLDLLIAAN